MNLYLEVNKISRTKGLFNFNLINFKMQLPLDPIFKDNKHKWIRTEIDKHDKLSCELLIFIS